MTRRMLIFTGTLLFGLGALADETIKPNGQSWRRIGSDRQLGYVEGYMDGIAVFRPTDDMCKNFAEFHKSNPTRENPYYASCVKKRLWGNTKIGVDGFLVLSTIDSLYSDPRNQVIRWSNAVQIAAAMVSGVPVSEDDLEVIREFDASTNMP